MTSDSIDLFPPLLSFSHFLVFIDVEEERQYSIEANKRNNSIKGLRHNKIKSRAHQKRKLFVHTPSLNFRLFFTLNQLKVQKKLKIESANKFFCYTIN